MVRFKICNLSQGMGFMLAEVSFSQEWVWVLWQGKAIWESLDDNIIVHKPGKAIWESLDDNIIVLKIKTATIPVGKTFLL